MSALYEVIHRTEYRNSSPVLISNQALHLQPRILDYQEVVTSEVLIHPRPAERHMRFDYFGNPMTFFTIAEPHHSLRIDCRHEVIVQPRHYPKVEETPSWEFVDAQLRTETSKAALGTLEYCYPSPCVPFSLEVRDWCLPSFPAGRPVMEAALELNHRIFTEFKFDPTATTVSTPLEEVMKKRRGVCQDFSHLAVAACRAMGIPARYVSGYLRTLPAPGEVHRFGADSSHAWFSFYCPGHGWIDLDPTNDKAVGDTYITLGWGRDYSDVSLIRGILSGGGDHGLYLSVNVQRLDEEKEPEPAAAAAAGIEEKVPLPD